jgi:activating signal cointegrator complex subunit 2
MYFLFLVSLSFLALLILIHFVGFAYSNSTQFPRSGLLQDSSTIERMKRDILRRVEEMEEAEAELFEQGEAHWKPKATVRADVVYDEDDIGVGANSIRLLGDGESDTDPSTESDVSDAEHDPLDPETVIEQAYLRDPAVFDRDGNTRRGIARIELRRLTGWADEQIEGWRVMLERTVGVLLLFWETRDSYLTLFLSF